jgi:hypothetical protein
MALGTKPWRCAAAPLGGILLLAGCADSVAPAGPAARAEAPPPVRVSQDTPFSAGCDGAGQGLYANAEVEPHVAIHPLDPQRMVGAWQQDRRADGGARGLASARSLDGGRTWSVPAALPFSRCAGNGAFDRATDPWVAISPDGVVHLLSLSFSGDTFAAGSTSAVLAVRSVDGGASWSAPQTLQQDGADFFNDKISISADPRDARYVYATWDRLDRNSRGPALVARSLDGGRSWQPARVVHDPGAGSQTIGNQIVVLADGSLLLLFTELSASGQGYRARLMLMRSGDRGASWSAPDLVAEMFPVGTADPDTGQPVRDGSILFDVAVGATGQLAAVWQDARASGGDRDGIAFTRSDDGGRSWSAPVQINGEAQVAAFTPTVTVTDRGGFGVDYFDFRPNTPDAASLPTAGWLAVSDDGELWREQQVSGPFDLQRAPQAGGLFLGDYKGLRAIGAEFLLFFPMTGDSDANRTDIFSQRVRVDPAAAARAAPVLSATVTPALAARVHQNLRRHLRDEQPPRKRALKRKQ